MSKKRRRFRDELKDAFDTAGSALMDAHDIATAGPKVIRKYGRALVEREHPHHFALFFLEHNARRAKDVLLDLTQAIVNAEARLIAAKRNAGENVKNRVDATILPFERKKAARSRLELRGSH